jgi:hypothetical protein
MGAQIVTIDYKTFSDPPSSTTFMTPSYPLTLLPLDPVQAQWPPPCPEACKAHSSSFSPAASSVELLIVSYFLGVLVFAFLIVFMLLLKFNAINGAFSYHLHKIAIPSLSDTLNLY